MTYLTESLNTKFYLCSKFQKLHLVLDVDELLVSYEKVLGPIHGPGISHISSKGIFIKTLKLRTYYKEFLLHTSKHFEFTLVSNRPRKRIDIILEYLDHKRKYFGERIYCKEELEASKLNRTQFIETKLFEETFPLVNLDSKVDEDENDSDRCRENVIFFKPYTWLKQFKAKIDEDVVKMELGIDKEDRFLHRLEKVLNHLHNQFYFFYKIRKTLHMGSLLSTVRSVVKEKIDLSLLRFLDDPSLYNKSQRKIVLKFLATKNQKPFKIPKSTKIFI